MPRRASPGAVMTGFARSQATATWARGMPRDSQTSRPLTRARAHALGHQLGEHMDRLARAAPAHDLPINRSLVGARVERISSARAPEMCPFSKTIKTNQKNQTVRENLSRVRESN